MSFFISCIQFFSRHLNPVLIIDFCAALEIRIVNHVLKSTMIADAILSRSDLRPCPH